VSIKQLNIAGAIIIAILVQLLHFYAPVSGRGLSAPSTVQQNDKVYLPVTINNSSSAAQASGPRIHIPYLNYTDIPRDRIAEMSVFWFGQVTPHENYADVRLGYNNEAIFIYMAVIDRLLWYAPNPSPGSLTAYDAMTIYLDTANNSGNSPQPTSYRIEVQASPESVQRAGYQSFARWNGTSWARGSSSITTSAGWRGSGFNNEQEDKGWTISLKIPFSAVGLSGPPASGSQWRAAFVLHDRDSASTSLPTKTWPTVMNPNQPGSWNRLSFGLPAPPEPVGQQSGAVSIQHGQNGDVVKDASVGGNTTCGEGLNYWRDWGGKVYNQPSNELYMNVQNQRDISDWPCFSKLYVNFPLERVPQGKTIRSARLILHQLGNSGIHYTSNPLPRSLIQVFTVDRDWDPATLSWNNAPLATENVSRTWVDALDATPAWPGVMHEWNVTEAVRGAYQNGTPLRLALYSADGAYHTGKYFVSSEIGDWSRVSRPTLIVTWSD
jgi:hypothetical protein